MLFSNDRNEVREMYYQVWEKHNAKQALTPMEHIICAVIQEHPEYHKFLKNKSKHKQKDFSPEAGQTNPFLHMGLHIAIREQLATNRPFGIKGVYTELMEKHHSNSTVEHLMMEHLMDCLMNAQKTQPPPNELHYINQLRQLLK